MPTNRLANGQTQVVVAFTFIIPFQVILALILPKIIVAS
jgi:hypothetical protein